MGRNNLIKQRPMDSKKLKLKVFCAGYKSQEIADYLHEEAIADMEVVKCNVGINEDDLQSLFADQPEIVVIFTSPTGIVTDNTPLKIARIAQQSGIVTIGIVTMPFICEGEKSILRALNFADELSQHTDSMITINLENILDYNELFGFSVLAPLKPVVKICSQQLRNLSLLMTTPQATETIKYALKNSKIFYTATGEGKGKAPISRAIGQILHEDNSNESLIKSRPYFNFESSRVCILKIIVKEGIGTEESIAYLKELTLFTSKLPCSCDISIKFEGDPDLEDGVRFIMLLASFDTEIPLIKKEKKGCGE